VVEWRRYLLIDRTKRDVLQENLWLVLEHITERDIDGDEELRSNLTWI